MNTGISLPYGISLIKALLPHREPFLLVDRVTELELGQRIVAEKTLATSDPCFEGHFPGNPIMPGVLVSKALAQTSGLLLALTWENEERSGGPGISRLLFLANVNMKFSSTAKPGDTLRLESSLKKQYGKLYYFETAAHAGFNQIAKGTLALAHGE